MHFSSDFLDDLRTRLPISLVIGQRVTFDSRKSKSSRGDFWCCCPFHGEKTPSFHCDDRKGRYYCFGCGVKGDIFTFLCELDGLHFSEAVERLAHLAGIAVPILDPQSYKREKQKSDLYNIMQIATDFFHKNLFSSEGRQALRYLDERGVTIELIKRFRIGFASARRTALKDALSAQGISVKQMEDCGLLISGEDIAVPYDRFRNRILFPIEDLRERVVAFGGRALDKEALAKYLNSPETVLFHKGNILYNAASARKNSRSVKSEERHSLIVVEGYMDVISLTKAGFEQVVAPLGTALTETQIQLLWQIKPDPILCFDGDNAGINAALRVADRVLPLLRAGVSVRVVLLPQGTDPDEIIHSNGAQFFTSLLQKSMSLVELLWQRATYGKHFETPEERAALERKLRQKIFTIKDGDIRRYYLQDIKKRLFVFFRSSSFKQKTMQGYSENRKNSLFGKTSFPLLEKSNMLRTPKMHSASVRDMLILLILVHYPELWHEDFETLSALEFKNSQLIILHRTMLEILGNQSLYDKETMVLFLEERGQKTILEQMEKRLHNVGIHKFFVGASIEDVRIVLKQAVYLHLKEHHLHKRIKDIQEQYIENPNDEILNSLREMQSEIKHMQETETLAALIEGFGYWFDERTDKK
ncbi:DNA primase [Bartonella sp. F02]|uniref:DNA primase n=1 Tax=Bartonella sp. F02 TaxID=2967262 RepID=UPI0022A982B7|nr:DNA primase [Bartonella sp. F02]MCZ2328687.1 DNA primase [Bartonella sp. F02]